VEADENVNYHFVSFARVGDHVVEFDGGKPSYVVHAACPSQDEFMRTCGRVIKEEYFDRAEGGGNFSIIVLAPATDE
jgi:hypothetical protein